MLTARKAAEYLGLNVRSFYELGIPCYKYSPRRSRWDKADLDAFKAQCRSIPQKGAGAGRLTVSFKASATDLRNSFLRAGVALKPKHTTGRNPAESMPSGQDSNSQDSHSPER